MELTKEAISSVQLTVRFWIAYDAKEVDHLLDEISAAAERQSAELEQLRSMQAEYMQTKNMVSTALLTAQKSAADLLEETRIQCNEELATMQKAKLTLQQEISSLEQYKIHEIERIQAELGRLLGDSRAEVSRRVIQSVK